MTGGTRVLSDWIVVRVTVNPGEAFIDRMIAMVEGAKRQKTPNEIALTILLVALTWCFSVRHRHAAAVLDLQPSTRAAGTASASPVTITVLVALLVCLIPTTIGGLLSAIGVAGMSRMMQANVIATSGRAVEAAGDVDVLLLDKTGTITLGNRQAAASSGAPGRRPRQDLADAAQTGVRSRTKRRKGAASSRWPSSASILRERRRWRPAARRDLRAVHGADAHERRRPAGPRRPVAPRGAQGRRRCVRKHVKSNWDGSFPPRSSAGAVDRRDRAARQHAAGGRRQAMPPRVLGVVELKDIVKGGIKERFAELRQHGHQAP